MFCDIFILICSRLLLLRKVIEGHRSKTQKDFYSFFYHIRFFCNAAISRVFQSLTICAIVLRHMLFSLLKDEVTSHLLNAILVRNDVPELSFGISWTASQQILHHPEITHCMTDSLLACNMPATQLLQFLCCM